MAKKIFQLIFLAVIYIVSAQLMLKYGLQNAPSISYSTIIPYFQEVLLNPYIILGVFLFALSALLWLMVLSKTELSYAYPALSLGYALTAVGAWLLFHENLNALRITGIIIVCVGVIMLSKS